MTVETVEQVRADEAGGVPGTSKPVPSQGSEDSARGPGWYVRAVFIGLLLLGAVWLAIKQEKARSSFITVAIAVGGSAALWIGANLLFNQVRSRWQVFSAISWAILGFLAGAILFGNQVAVGSGEGFLTWIIGPVAGAIAFSLLGFAIAATESTTRQAVAVGGSLAIGIAIGALIREQYHPGLDLLAIVVYTVVVAGIGAGISVLAKRNPVGGALIGAAIGWTLGAWGGADLGGGSIVTSIVACAVPAILIGLRLALSPNPDYRKRVDIDNGSRAVIFLGPGLLFIFVMLVVPALRTGYLSLLDRNSQDFVGVENYTDVFTDSNSLDYSGWRHLFTSAPFLIGVVLLAIAVVVGFTMRKRTGRAVEIGNPTMAPLVVGGLLVAFGAFTALRGTIINNLWWVVTVTFASTALGLAVAVLADNKLGERFAKSLIFMPMAISLVGASVIWRFMYAARDTNVEQTGVINALWVGLGRLSTGSGIPTLVATIVLGVIVVACLVVLTGALVKREWGRAVVPGILVLLVGWFFIRFVGLVGAGVGGFAVRDDGSVVGNTVLFIQETPYNNFWLMIILIWIQTGFAMVILSAAIKAVPTELIEAAKMDGATDSQVFWRVTLPQIGTTIGVVVTTLIVLVMKVYDIVKVVTNGNFGTQVLANDMFNTAFSDINIGKGAALAMLIFVSVVPVMFYNIRRMQKDN